MMLLQEKAQKTSVDINSKTLLELSLGRELSQKSGVYALQTLYDTLCVLG